VFPDYTVDNPVTVLPKPINIKNTKEARCESERQYTAQIKDTCKSIAERYSCSDARLHYLNLELTDCITASPGTRLCLQDQCEVIYKFYSKYDICVKVPSATEPHESNPSGGTKAWTRGAPPSEAQARSEAESSTLRFQESSLPLLRP
jgi:hypothetical protein